jgi:ribonuclease III
VTDGRDTRLAALQARLGHAFRDPALLDEALTHPSWTSAHPDHPHNQRLEFLGDAVLQFVATDRLFRALPGAREGDLSRLRRTLVAGGSEAAVGRTWDLGAGLRLGPSEERDGGRDRDRVLEDAFEAVVGAVYLDGGLEAVRTVLEPFLAGLLASGRSRADEHPKTLLMEAVQSLGLREPVYEVVEAQGPDHLRAFRVVVRVGGAAWGEGTGKSRREAERDAAQRALGRLADEEVR